MRSCLTIGGIRASVRSGLIRVSSLTAAVMVSLATPLPAPAQLPPTTSPTTSPFERALIEPAAGQAMAGIVSPPSGPDAQILPCSLSTTGLSGSGGTCDTRENCASQAPCGICGQCQCGQCQYQSQYPYPSGNGPLCGSDWYGGHGTGFYCGSPATCARCEEDPLGDAYTACTGDVDPLFGLLLACARLAQATGRSIDAVCTAAGGPLDHLDAAATNQWDSLHRFEAVCAVDDAFQSALCHCQCKWVNCRPGAVYLEGCIPAGYSQFAFIQSVCPLQTYYGPLHMGGPVEPGGSWAESAVVDGDGTKPLALARVNVSLPTGDAPPDRAAEKFAQLTPRTHLPGTHRVWNGASYYWQASLIAHQPLYFEDVNLERHGYSYGVAQPFVSGAKFFATLPALPYLMAAYPAHQAYYPLGESRPGSHAPYVTVWPPRNVGAAAVQAGVVTGLIFLIP